MLLEEIPGSRPPGRLESSLSIAPWLQAQQGKARDGEKMPFLPPPFPRPSRSPPSLYSTYDPTSWLPLAKQISQSRPTVWKPWA